MFPSEASDYRPAPAVVARMVGSYLVLLALVMFAATAVVAVADWPADLLVGVLAVGVAGMVAVAWWLRERAFVVRFDAEEFRLGLVRGPGPRQGRWADVTDASASTWRGAPCLELRLRNGEIAVIPVAALAVTDEELVADVRERLQRGHGLRPL